MQPPPGLTATDPVCATMSARGPYSERELKEAALRQDVHFRNWFHRDYKDDVGLSVGGTSNPDLARNLVRDAYEEWIACGMPRSK